jgi:hypothetical protein
VTDCTVKDCDRLAVATVQVGDDPAASDHKPHPRCPEHLGADVAFMVERGVAYTVTRIALEG